MSTFTTGEIGLSETMRLGGLAFEAALPTALGFLRGAGELDTCAAADILVETEERGFRGAAFVGETLRACFTFVGPGRLPSVVLRGSGEDGGDVKEYSESESDCTGLLRVARGAIEIDTVSWRSPSVLSSATTLCPRLPYAKTCLVRPPNISAETTLR